MKKGILFIVMAGIMWGTSCLFAEIFVPYGFSSLQMTATRLSFAFVGMSLYCLFFYRSAFKVKVKDLLILFACGAGVFGTAAFYYESMRLTSASTSVVLMYISPVPIMLLSVLFLGERFNRKKGVAVGLMLIGCALVAGIVGDFKPDTVGVIMGLLSAASYTAYNIFCKLASKREIHPLSTSLYTYLFGAICALLFCRPWEYPALIGQKPLFLLPMMLLHSVITCLLPYFLYGASLRYVSVGVASALSIIEPLSGSLLGFLVLKQPLSLASLIGMVLVVGSVFLLSVSESDREKLHPQKHRFLFSRKREKE